MADLPVVTTPRPRQGSDVEEMLARDSTLVARVIAALEARIAVHAQVVR
jgi:hypothetical protein